MTFPHVKIHENSEKNQDRSVGPVENQNNIFWYPEVKKIQNFENSGKLG